MLFLSSPEVRRLADAMPELYRLPVYVAAYRGLRAGELWALRRRDVDLLHGVLRVERALKEINTSAEPLAGEKGLVFGPTRTHAARAVSLPAFLRPLLSEHLASPSPGAPGPTTSCSRRAQGAPCDTTCSTSASSSPPCRAGLPERLHGLRWHDLRHTWRRCRSP